MAFGGLIKFSFFKRQLHVISRSKSNVKPASPTPLNLKQYILPLYDRMLPKMYMPVLLLYQSPQPKASTTATTISDHLKNTLSDTLSQYYPLAGRLMYGSYVDCNDKGIPFVEARIGCKLSQILEKDPHDKSEEDGLGNLFPPGLIWNELSKKHDSSLVMAVQVNHFDCGGIAIATSISHRIGDGSTLLSFLNYWATLSRSSGDQQKVLHLRPRFMYEYLPKSYDKINSFENEISFPEKHWITKEIVFHNSKIAELKTAMEIEDKLKGVVDDQKYTRNELVTALIYKSAVAAAAKSNSGVNVPSVMFQVINMRPMVDPPLPETTFGNLFTVNPIPTSTESETKLSVLVNRIRKGKMQLRGTKSLDGHEVEPISPENTDKEPRTYLISSICNYPFHDNMDFGWGVPIKTTIVDTPFVDFFILMDTPCKNGIKAIIGLKEEEMENFQADKELFAYASF